MSLPLTGAGPSAASAAPEGSITDSDNAPLLDGNAEYIIEGGGSFSLMPSGGSITVITTGTIEGRDWHGRAAMATLSNGNFALSYRSGVSHSDNGDAVLRIRFSDDKGATWTAEDTKLGGGAVTGFPMTPPGGGTGDNSGPGEPMFYLAPNGNLILHMWLVDYSVSRGGTWQSISSDNGETWSTPATQVAFGIGGTSDDHVFATDDYFVYDGVIYAGARVWITDNPEGASQSILIKSENNGTTWSMVSIIQDTGEGGTGGQEVGLEYLGDDTIIAMLRDNAHTNSYKRISTDMGLTWNALVDVTGIVGIAGRQRLFTTAHLRGEDNWWEDDQLLMVGFIHKSSGNSHPRQNAVWLSGDSGSNWEPLFYIDEELEDGGYGQILYDSVNDEYVYVSNLGANANTDLKQYRFKLSGGT